VTTGDTPAVHGVDDEAMHAIRATGDGPDDPDRPVLEITGGEGNFDDPARPEVHLLMRSTCGCCQDFAQGWFRVDELRAAIDAAVANPYDESSADPPGR
jgi:hypothetical protein